MASIVELEKARQEDIFRTKSKMITSDGRYEIKLIIDTHKQSLINLKEYMEEMFNESKKIFKGTGIAFMGISLGSNIIELTKLIEAYE